MGWFNRIANYEGARTKRQIQFQEQLKAMLSEESTTLLQDLIGVQTVFLIESILLVTHMLTVMPLLLAVPILIAAVILKLVGIHFEPPPFMDLFVYPLGLGFFVGGLRFMYAAIGGVPDNRLGMYVKLGWLSHLPCGIGYIIGRLMTLGLGAAFSGLPAYALFKYISGILAP